MFVCREGVDTGGNPGESMEPDTLNSTKFAQKLGICRKKLEPCGVRIEVLARRKTGLLLYVYRPTMLRAYLAQPDVFGYLQDEGYDPSDLSGCIAKLHRRICGTDLAAALSGSCAFPHEIGFFLGYPYDDVVGFIENKGKNSLCSGCWKVYSRARDAQACFCCYKTCTAAYEEGEPWLDELNQYLAETFRIWRRFLKPTILQLISKLRRPPISPGLTLIAWAQTIVRSKTASLKTD